MDSIVHKQPNVTTLVRVAGNVFALRYVGSRVVYWRVRSGR